jgi:hypothetical protein
VPDDRFADLGRGTRAGDRLADLDQREPEHQAPPPRRRGSYTWVVGVAAVLAIIVAGVNALPNARRGDNGPPAGKPLPRFAAPDARAANVDFDANINQSPSDPAPGSTPACAVRVPGAVRSCDLTSKPLVLTFIVPTTACEDFVDRVERLRPRFRRVNFLVVLSGKSDQARAVVRRRGWPDPVVLDRNGALLTRYRLGLCASVVFAYRGGIVRTTKTQAQEWTDAQLTAAVRATEKR